MIIHWLAIVGTDHWEFICHQWSRIRRDITSLIARGTLIFVFAWCIFALLIAVCQYMSVEWQKHLVLIVNSHVCVTMLPWWAVCVVHIGLSNYATSLRIMGSLFAIQWLRISWPVASLIATSLLIHSAGCQYTWPCHYGVWRVQSNYATSPRNMRVAFLPAASQLRVAFLPRRLYLRQCHPAVTFGRHNTCAEIIIIILIIGQKISHITHWNTSWHVFDIPSNETLGCELPFCKLYGSCICNATLVSLVGGMHSVVSKYKYIYIYKYKYKYKLYGKLYLQCHSCVTAVGGMHSVCSQIWR